jgi:Arc/MetJ-type ribon-helix-helix transcriptional regulator
VLGQSVELGIRAGAGQDLGIARGHHAPALPFECLGDDCRAAAAGAGTDEFVEEVDELVRESNSDLLAHPNMVAKRDQGLPAAYDDDIRRTGGRIIGMKVSVSLPGEDLMFLDAYARAHAYPSRSAVVHQAISALRLGELHEAYGDSWAEWSASGEADSWDAVASDGM